MLGMKSLCPGVSSSKDIRTGEADLWSYWEWSPCGQVHQAVWSPSTASRTVSALCPSSPHATCQRNHACELRFYIQLISMSKAGTVCRQLCETVACHYIHIQAATKTYLFAPWWTPSGAVTACLRVWCSYIRLLTYLLTCLSDSQGQQIVPPLHLYLYTICALSVYSAHHVGDKYPIIICKRNVIHITWQPWQHAFSGTDVLH